MLRDDVRDSGMCSELMLPSVPRFEDFFGITVWVSESLYVFT